MRCSSFCYECQQHVHSCVQNASVVNYTQIHIRFSCCKIIGMLLCCNVMRICCNIFTKLKLLFVIDAIREVFQPCERCTNCVSYVHRTQIVLEKFDMKAYNR